MTEPAALPIRRLAVVALLALAGCGQSTPADAPASADNVEIPAEAALSGVTAEPVADPGASASAAASDAASADLPPAEAAAAIASDAASN